MSEELFKKISGHRSKNEKLAWVRKYNKIQELIKIIEPIEDKILILMEEKQSIFDEMTELRKIMIKECIHPIDMLVDKTTYVRCKFCNSKIRSI